MKTTARTFPLPLRLPLCLLLLTIAGMSGCQTADLNKSLDKALQLATGPCGQKIAEAAAVCRQQLPAKP